MITLDRRRTFEGKKPYDAIVEYLTGNGNQNIMLSLNVGAGTFFEVSGSIWVSNSGQASANDKIYIYTNGVKSFNSSNNQYSLYYYQKETNGNATCASFIGEDSNSGGIGFKGGVFNTFALSTAGKTLNGVFSTLERPLTGTINSITLNFAPTAKFGWVKIKAGNVTLYDLIPVRVGTTGFMYDKISKQLFGNNGSGNIILGPDLNKVGNLLYWWESEDSLVSNNWSDRIQGTKATATNANKVDGLYELQGYDLSPNRYFTLNALNSGTSQLVLPAAWKVEVEAIIPGGQTSSQNCYFFDFGSVTSASHAFALSYKYSDSKISVNYKPTNNSDGSRYGMASADRLLVDTDRLIKIEVGTSYVNSNQVQLYTKYNETTTYGIAPHTDYSYNGNWNQIRGYFGWAYTSSYMGGKCYLKSIKIYNNT